jgi:DNA excision repair protein ERCC-3
VVTPDGPLIVQSDKTLLLEVDHPAAADCRAAIAPFAELERSPEHVHTYRLTPLGLWNARAAGHDAEQVVDALVRFSRYTVPHALLVDVADTMDRYGRLKLEQDPVHGLVLRTTDRAVLEEVTRSKKVSPMLGARLDPDTVLAFPSERGRLKQALLKVGWPAEDLAGYVDGEAHPIELAQDGWVLRDYQQLAVDGFWLGGSGVVVLPCGAGKTLVGAAAMARAGATTLILVTNTVSGRQWKSELLKRTSLTEEEIGEYSGEKKEIKPVTIATYQVMTTRRKGEYAHLELFGARDWGLVVYDEVHLLPAPVFRMTADLQSRRRLGLTATLVREDGREGDVFSLIGPKRYDAPWKDIEAQGWIAPADCTEVRVTMTDAERLTYATAEPEERYKIASTAHTKIAVIRSSSSATTTRCSSSAPTSTSSTSSARRSTCRSSRARRRTPSASGCSTCSAARRSPGSSSRRSRTSRSTCPRPPSRSRCRARSARARRRPSASAGCCAQGGRPHGPLLHGRQPRHPRPGVRRPPPALPRRAGLRVHDRRRRRRAVRRLTRVPGPVLSRVAGRGTAPAAARRRGRARARARPRPR